MNRLIAIVGPTAVGKSRLAIQLARAFNGEIVSADSRQVYRHMDIGTAQPSPEELSLIPHHLLNIINPDQDFSLAQYQQLTYTTIDDIHQRRKLPLLVGGSGLYVWSVLEGWEIPPVPPDLKFRHDLEEKAAHAGKEELYQMLMNVDLVAAQKIDPRNLRRVIRALEVQRATQTPISRFQRKQPPSLNALIIGLTADRTELYHRIDSRVDRMVQQGLVAEVEKLINMGYVFNLPAMSGIGYKQIGMFLRDELTLNDAVQQIKYETHRVARHQYSWFRLKDDRIRWFDIQGQADPEITELVAKFIGEK